MKNCFLTLLLGFCVQTLPALAEVRLPRLFSDDAVLQQGRPVSVWGWAAADEDVSVRFKGQTQVTRADLEGLWRVSLDAMPASSEPADLVVQGKNTVTVKNVLVGEVWVCSGQSNMQWTVSQAGNAEQEVAAQFLPSHLEKNLLLDKEAP